MAGPCSCKKRADCIQVGRRRGPGRGQEGSRARASPEGILLTTPESLEAILVRRGGEAGRLFAALRYLVVDETHAFMDAERGRQLQSLMNRIEIAACRRVVRVGLSATLADMRTAAAFLRPLEPDGVEILESNSGDQPLKLQVRGYVQTKLKPRIGTGDDAAPETPTDAAIARAVSVLIGARQQL